MPNRNKKKNRYSTFYSTMVPGRRADIRSVDVRGFLTFTYIATFFDQNCKSNRQFFLDFKKCKWVNFFSFLCFIRFLTSL